MQLCKKYTDIFTLDNDTMTTNNFYEQKIRTNDENPVYTRNYRTLQGQKEEIDTQVNKLMRNDLIEPSLSPYNSPIILVPKKSQNNGRKWRLCIDYRRVKQKLIPDKFPLPRIDVILDGLGKAKYFSTLDLFSGFHQIPIEKESMEITAFTTEKGIFQWKVLPFGLNIAPNSFCRMMAIAFSGLKPEQCFLYVDDIIVLGRSEKHHMENLKTVFERCRKFNLKLNPEKCQFFKHEIVYLGHKCTNKGILPDESKIEAVRKYPRPTNKKEVKSFTAFVNYYRRFIQNYVELASPLNKLTGKRQEFIWTEECEKAFQGMRDKLISPQILQYPNFEEEFIVTVDASNMECGAVLSQEINGNDLPIAYVSRTFQKGEKNKPTIEKELLGIYFAVKSFEPYLWGRHFTIRTDHKPLVHLYNLKNPTSKLSLIRMELDNHNFTIVYIPGELNVTADALSRIDLQNSGYITNTNDGHKTDKPLKININEIREALNEENESNDEKEGQILAITRSRARQVAQANEANKNESNEKLKAMPIIEETNDAHLRGVPFLATNKENILRAIQDKRKLFQIDVKNVTNDTKTLEYLASRLEKMAGDKGISNIKWQKDDLFFKRVNIEQFKEACIRKLKRLRISILTPKIKVTDKAKQEELLRMHHDDPIQGGHAGRKRLLAKLKSKYFWKGNAS